MFLCFDEPNKCYRIFYVILRHSLIINKLIHNQIGNKRISEVLHCQQLRMRTGIPCSIIKMINNNKICIFIPWIPSGNEALRSYLPKCSACIATLSGTLKPADSASASISNLIHYKKKIGLIQFYVVCRDHQQRPKHS